MEDLTLDTSYIILKRGSIVVDQSDGEYPPYAIVQASQRAYRDPRVTMTIDQELMRALAFPEIRPARFGYKYCSNCNEEQPLQAFTVDSRMKDGRESRCKTCEAIRQRRLRAEAREVA